MKSARLISLLFALILQVMPMCRVVTTQFLPAASSGAAIVMRFVIGGVALFGAVHAVSGASTVITSPTSATGTNGVAFSYRITTGPQAASSFNAAPLPSGLTVSTSNGRITGTPTVSGSFTVLLTASGSGHTVTTNLALTILNGSAIPPSITSQPAGQTVTAGGTATFSVTASGTSPLSYQWRFGGANLSGQTSSSLTLSSVTTNQAGNYSVVVTNSAGSVTSAVAVLTVNPLIAPTITTQPQGQTVNAGANVTLSVVASGTAPLSYQWLFGGSALSGQTSATLQLNSVTTGQTGNYSVIVSNAAGSVTSANALLTVNALVAPSITTQPQGQTVLAGANVTFSVVASGTAPLSYQWYFGASLLPGQTGSALALSAVTTGQAGNYSVVVSNQVGTATSSSAALVVNQAPAITSQPQPQMVLAGGTAVFSVTATGSPAPTYQWRFGASNLAGQTGASLQLTGVTTNQAGNYTVVVSNSVGTVVSAPALLTVNTAAIAPSITTQPQGQTVFAGTNVTLSVVASGTDPLSYQWRFGGANLAGQTTSSLQLNSVTTGQTGPYTVIVTNVAGSITSAPAQLVVNAPVAPAITTQPLSQTVTAGGNVSFTAAASGTAPLSFQWRFNNSDIAGQTGTALQLSSVTGGQAGNYTVVVTNYGGSVTSTIAVLTVNVPPAITTQPQPQTVTVGNTANFSVTATGTSPLHYQWRFGGADIASATTSTLTLPSVALNQGGGYTVVITNVVGSITSAVAVLTVNQPVPVAPTITTQPQSQTVSAGSNATFTVVATGTAPLTYQWFLGSTNLANQTNTALALINVTSRQSGDYTVVVANSIGSVTSIVAHLTVNGTAPGTDPKAPWKAYAGSYNGLLYDTNGVAQGSAGCFTFKLTPRGTYSAVILLSGGWRLNSSGTLNADGTAVSTISRGLSSPVVVNWAIDLGGSDQITGYVGPKSGAWSAELSGDRALFNARTNPCPYAGKYTLDLPGTPGATNYPGGDSYAAVTVDANGIATLRGFLADKTAISQRVPLSKTGAWPLFVRLYSSTGSLLAWLQFENRPTDDFHGLASWIKPIQPTAKYYPGGFLVQNEIVGSSYNQALASGGVLNLTNGVALLVGDPAGAVTNSIHLVSAATVAGADPHALQANFKPATGLFNGSFVPAGETKAVPFGGALVQKANYAAGFFLGTGESGLVRLQNNPAP